VFHAIDYARRLGFQPHPDHSAALFGARPEELQATPWHAAEKPYYVAGPFDDTPSIVDQLRATVGDGNFAPCRHLDAETPQRIPRQIEPSSKSADRR
jgi:hypothetical protein